MTNDEIIQAIRNGIRKVGQEGPNTIDIREGFGSHVIVVNGKPIGSGLTVSTAIQDAWESWSRAILAMDALREQNGLPPMVTITEMVQGELAKGADIQAANLNAALRVMREDLDRAHGDQHKAEIRAIYARNVERILRGEEW